MEKSESHRNSNNVSIIDISDAAQRFEEHVASHSVHFFGAAALFHLAALSESHVFSGYTPLDRLQPTMQPPSSAIPGFYYALFAFYEPALTILGFVGALADPEATHNAQAPWPAGSLPPAALPKASIVTVIQLGHVCALMGLVNFFVLTAVRKHLASQLALQEKIIRALFIPLLLGDVLHLYVTLWALGDDRWAVALWTPMLWTTIALGFSLMIPRIMWHLGVWRYVDGRDRISVTSEDRPPSSQTEKW